MTPRSRRLLMVTYWYPPCAAWPTAAARVAGFARQLPEHGWETFVVVPALGSGICGCSGCRGRLPAPPTPDGVQVQRLAVRSTAVFRAWSQAGALAGAARAPRRQLAFAARQVLSAARVIREVDSDWTAVAMRHGLRLIEREGIDAVWTTSAPYEHVRLGHRLSRLTGRPWVADLRDPVARLRGATLPGKTLVELRRRPYRRMLAHAAEVVAVSPQLARLDGRWIGRPCAAVTSSFDPRDWPPGRTAPNERFTILYAGTFHRRFITPSRFLGMLSAFVQRLQPGQRDRVRFLYHGPKGPQLQGEAQRHGLDAVLEDGGVVSPDRARELMAAADVLLLLTNEAGDSGVPGGKLYEYLGARRPILAVPGTDEYVAEVLRRTSAGVAAASTAKGVAALERWHAEWVTAGGTRYAGDERAVAAYALPETTRRLAGLLDRAVCATPALVAPKRPGPAPWGPPPGEALHLQPGEALNLPGSPGGGLASYPGPVERL